MAYPDQIDTFSEKLNKKPDGGVYAIEEEIALTDGTFEGFLSHDNIINSTVKVYTGPKFSGDKVMTWTLSTPADAPWRRIIKVFSNAPQVYVTYETPGDTVEADDINAVQASIVATQTELERYKADGIIDGGTFTREV